MPKKSPKNHQTKRGKRGGARPGTGGKRTGAGRPKLAVTQLTETARETTARTIANWLPDLLNTMKTLATSGDRGACEYLINRLLGRPAESAITEQKTVTVMLDGEAGQQFRDNHDSPVSSGPSEDLP